MATDKFEAYTGGVYSEHHYFTFMSLVTIITVAVKHGLKEHFDPRSINLQDLGPSMYCTSSPFVLYFYTFLKF